MSKGLETLKDFKEDYCANCIGICKECELKIIEKELKEYEMEHTLRVRLENINYELVREKQENEKKLKALEIIKNKNVFVWGFIHRQEETSDFKPTYEYYTSHYGYFHSGYDCDKYLLTQEEYDLLKEVLL